MNTLISQIWLLPPTIFALRFYIHKQENEINEVSLLFIPGALKRPAKKVITLGSVLRMSIRPSLGFYAHTSSLVSSSLGTLFVLIGRDWSPVFPHICMYLLHLQLINICLCVRRYHHYEEDSDFCYIALEFAGGSLEDFVEGNYTGPDIKQSNILEQATEGLRWLHSVHISKLYLLQVLHMVQAPEIWPICVLTISLYVFSS